MGIAQNTAVILGIGIVIDKVFGTSLVIPKDEPQPDAEEQYQAFIEELEPEQAANIYRDVVNATAGEDMYGFDDPEYLEQQNSIIQRAKSSTGDWSESHRKAATLINELGRKGLITREEVLTLADAVSRNRDE